MAKRSSGEKKALARAGDGPAKLYARLFEAIGEHRLRPGSKLVEERLAELFAVSRTVVRQALTQLAQEGLVELKPNRGAFVASPSVAHTRAIFEARRLLEPAVAARLAATHGSHHIAALRTHVRAEDRARNADDRAALVRLTGEFHIKLAGFAGNDVLTGFLRELEAKTALAILLYDRPGHSACLPAEHARIVDAIERGDARAAQTRMRAHLVHVEGGLDLDRTHLPPSDPVDALDPASGRGTRVAPRRPKPT
jgi:DNA-binding GntR family transcriptional regulator